MIWGYIAGVAGGIVLLGNAGAAIYKWIAPALKMKKKVEDLETKTVEEFDAIKKLEKAVEQNEKVNRMHLMVMLDMLNHMIDGNGVEAMKKTRADIEKLLAGIEG